MVWHPIYSAIIFGAAGLALVTENWLRLGMSVVLFVFFDLKARKEERWLAQKYAEYRAYRLHDVDVLACSPKNVNKSALLGVLVTFSLTYSRKSRDSLTHSALIYKK